MNLIMQINGKAHQRELNIVTPKPSDFKKTRSKIAYHLDTPCTWTSFSIWHLLKDVLRMLR